MKASEADKIIAEFMFPNSRGSVPSSIANKKFTTSLDALVPVWEKLYAEIKMYYDCKGQDESHFVEIECVDKYKERYTVEGVWCESFQKSAAIVTAKAILELG